MTTEARSLLHALGTTIRTMRKGRGWTRRNLAEQTGISERFLADIETGKANPSLLKLCDVATALKTTAVGLLSAHLTRHGDGRSGIIALLGMRGAGKSTIGNALSAALDCPFIELDAEVERDTGLELSQIFELHGESFFRQAEHEALRKLLINQRQPFILATGGGLVTERATFDLLRAHTRTVWLKAQPEDHWSRVIAQGDTRPMANHDRAFAAMREIVSERRSLYEQAEVTIETSGRDVSEIAKELQEMFEGACRTPADRAAG